MNQNPPNIVAKVEVQETLPTAVVLCDAKNQDLGNHITDILKFQNLNVVDRICENYDYLFSLITGQAFLKKAGGSINLTLEDDEQGKIEDAAFQITRLMFSQTDQTSVSIKIPPQQDKAPNIGIPVPVVPSDPVVLPISRPMQEKPNFRLLKVIILAVTLTLFTIIVAPLICLGLNVFLIYKDAQILEKQISSGQVTNTKQIVEQFGNRALTSRTLLQKLSPLVNLFNQKQNASRLDRLLFAAQTGSQAGLAILSASDKMATLEGVLSDKQVNWDQVAQARPDLEQAQRSLGLLQAISNDPLFDKYREKLKLAGTTISLTLEILPKLKDIVASSGQKSYLVLLQNNTELRPSGGFIGAYALVTFDHGRLLSYKINDVYDADGQLKGKITPPDEILHFLGQPNWYLRDSNFSADFSLSGKRAAWFLEKETGEKVDGVVGIDLYLVQKFLKVIGPVYLPDFAETITDQNFFEKAEYQAEINFFPGSTKKKDYLLAVSQKILEKLTENGQMMHFAPAIIESLEGRHLQFYFSDPEVQEIFENFNFTGTVSISNREFDNSLAIVEANFGANKANYFVKRSIDIKENIAKTGDIEVTVKINLTNTSPTDAWPAGVYENYLRLYAPTISKLKSVSIGDSKIATVSAILEERVLKRIEKDQFLVLETRENKNISWGVLNEVRPGATREITFVYLLPALDFEKSQVAHNIYVRKQAGTGQDSLSITIDHPSFLNPILTVGDNPLVSTQQIRYNTSLSTDKSFNIVWKK